MHQMEIIDRNDQATHWAACFDLSENDLQRRAHYPQMLSITREDLLTSKLPATLRLQREIDAGNLVVMGLRASETSFNLLDLLCVIGLHAALARSGFGALRRPAYWVSLNGAVRPTITVAQICEVTGLSLPALRTLLAPLVEDAVIQIVVAPNNIPAIVLADGVIDVARIQRHFRR